MHTRFFSVVFGLGLGLAVTLPPAHAADEIEAKAQLCAACHGDKGAPADPKTTPVIWGQDQSYLMKQMRDFRSGERKSAIMSPIAKGLAEGDLRRIPAHFAAKTWPAKRASAKPRSPWRSPSPRGPPRPPGAARAWPALPSRWRKSRPRPTSSFAAPA